MPRDLTLIELGQAITNVYFPHTAVIALVVDLDRPQEGALTVSQQALIDVRQSMNPPAP